MDSEQLPRAHQRSTHHAPKITFLGIRFLSFFNVELFLLDYVILLIIFAMQIFSIIVFILNDNIHWNKKIEFVK